MINQIRSDLLKRPSLLSAYLCSYRKLYETHYEVLNLANNCTSKDIKEAFIKLSKEHHPDVNKSKHSHSKFLKINEAYNVLSKPESRRSYDLSLPNKNFRMSKEQYTNYRKVYRENTYRDPWSDPLFWANRNRSRDRFYEEQSYYGVRGVPRLSNGIIVFYCIVFALMGVTLQYLAINHSFTLQREEMIRKSKEAQDCLDQTKAVAVNNGNNKQIEMLKLKLLGSTND